MSKNLLYAFRVQHECIFRKNETDIHYVRYSFIGCKSVFRYYVYEEDVTEHTLLFSSEEEASASKRKHFQNCIDREQIYIVALSVNEIKKTE